MNQDLPTKIGLLWRGDRAAPSPTERVAQQLGPLMAAFEELPVQLQHIVYADDAVEAVRQELLGLDGVLVWVNPIQDGADRALLDALLRDVAALGVWVSADPAIILTLGTKEILHRTRQLSWGSDVELYRSADELAARLPARLQLMRRLVVKQARGNGGNGVWKVEMASAPTGTVDLDTEVVIQDALSRDGSTDRVTLGDFLDRCASYLAWSGCLVDQAYQERLAEGMVRCYLSHDRVVGFCRQWPQGLLAPTDRADAAPPSIMQPVDQPEHQALRRLFEDEWMPQLLPLLGVEARQLPAIWDADFLYGPRRGSGEDSYVLCEINVSAVWPFPSGAAPVVAAAAMSRTVEARARRDAL